MTLRTQRDRLNNYLTQATVLANDLDRMTKDKNTAGRYDNEQKHSPTR